MVSLNIDSIGIIGAGPGGLASLYEFLHTNKDGTSTVGTGKRAETPAFSKIVAFEQKIMLVEFGLLLLLMLIYLFHLKKF